MIERAAWVRLHSRMSAPVPMLKMAKISKVYRTGLIETEALEVTLEVAHGEFVAVMGPSGRARRRSSTSPACSTTTTAATTCWTAQDVAGLNTTGSRACATRSIGFIFQSFNLIPDLDVFDNVDVPLRYRRLPTGERRHRVEEALVKLGLTARMRHLPAQLSGGQQQRVAIARALVGSRSSARRRADRQPGLAIARGRCWICSSGSTRTADDNRHGHARSELAARAHRKLHILDGRLILHAAADRRLRRRVASAAS